MTEREFQNMFTFAAGFEAAMLKVPHAVAVERREKELALAAASGSLDSLSSIPLTLQQQVAARHTNPASMLAELQGLHEQYTRSSLTSTTTADESGPPGQQPEEAALASLTSQLQHTTTISSDGGKSRGDRSRDPATSTRRQTIGFARFRSRAEALVARDILQGRKVDIFPGSVLKAEMAKKNLHTKRGVAGDEFVGMLVRTGRLPGLLAGMGMGGFNMPSSNASVAGMTSGTSTPSGQVQGNSVMPPTLPAPAPAVVSRPTTAADTSSRAMSGLPRPAPPSEGGDPQTEWRETRQSSWSAGWNGESQDDEGDRTVMQTDRPPSRPAGPEQRRSEDLMRSPLPPPTEDEARRFEQGASRRTTDPSVALSSSASQTEPSPESSAASPSDKPKDSKALLALAEEADDLEMWRVSNMDQLGHIEGESRTGTPNHTSIIMGDASLPPPQYRDRQPPLAYGVPLRDAADAGIGHEAPTLINPNRQFIGLQSTLLPATKPADQNPPINTLYVGNLPAAPSPSHPPNLLEDSLRHLFGQCVGFKRLSYRQKLTPQCFVEFVDVPSATRAMRELYGHTLNGLVRGGIRIAYSRNPLGQRGSQFSPPTRTVPTPYVGGVGSGSYIQAPLSPSSVSSTGLAFGMQFSSVGTSGPPPTYRRTSESSTPLSPQAAPFSLSMSATSPRFSATNGMHSPRDHAPVSPPLPSSMPWISGTGPTGTPSFSAFDAPQASRGRNT